MLKCYELIGPNIQTIVTYNGPINYMQFVANLISCMSSIGMTKLKVFSLSACLGRY